MKEKERDNCIGTKEKERGRGDDDSREMDWREEIGKGREKIDGDVPREIAHQILTICPSTYQFSLYIINI